MKNPLVQFASEFALRLFSEKPQFFSILQWVSAAVGAISGMITYLESTGQQIPGWLHTIGNANVTIAAITAVVMSQLPNKAPSAPTPQPEEKKA